MSGYDDRQVVQRYVVQRAYRLLAKPFSPDALQSAVEAAMDSGEASGAEELSQPPLRLGLVCFGRVQGVGFRWFVQRTRRRIGRARLGPQ